jgi:formamidopyrimidine-DNA glycosylase
VLLLDSGDALVIEPRMTGLVLLADPPTVAHLRLRICLTRPSQGGALYGTTDENIDMLFWDRRGLGTVTLLSADELENRLGDQKRGGQRVGPDALEIDEETLQSRLNTSRRDIKVALLDQRVLAGVGNLYASELLHLAKIHPQTTCAELTRRQWKNLHQAMRSVLQTAIQYEGSTLSDGTYRNALNQPGGYQNHHRVYDRVDQLCLTCQQGKIKRIVQCGRSTFYCPRCQKKKRV